MKPLLARALVSTLLAVDSPLKINIISIKNSRELQREKLVLVRTVFTPRRRLPRHSSYSSSYYSWRRRQPCDRALALWDESTGAGPRITLHAQPWPRVHARADVHPGRMAPPRPRLWPGARTGRVRCAGGGERPLHAPRCTPHAPRPTLLTLSVAAPAGSHAQGPADRCGGDEHRLL